MNSIELRPIKKITELNDLQNVKNMAFIKVHKPEDTKFYEAEFCVNLTDSTKTNVKIPIYCLSPSSPDRQKIFQANVICVTYLEGLCTLSITKKSKLESCPLTFNYPFEIIKNMVEDKTLPDEIKNSMYENQINFEFENSK